VVHDALASAYAEGRIDRDELDERTAEVDAAKTYGALVPPLKDLAADAAAPAVSATPRPELERQAQQYYRDKLRETFFEFLIPNLICWTIWYLTGHDYFPWPIFVTIPTLLHVLQVASNKRRMVDQRITKLERRSAGELAPPKKKDAQTPEPGEAILREEREREP
jgi:hypothetical protein